MNFKFLGVALVAAGLSACGSKGRVSSESTSPQEPRHPPALVIKCVPIANELAPVAEQKPPSNKKKSRKSSKQQRSAPESVTSEPPVSKESISPDANGRCPAGTDAVVEQAKPEPESVVPDSAKGGSEVRTVKSRDGSFDGEVHGRPAKGSKLAKIQIGMTMDEVERLVGPPDNYRRYVTGKAFIPFYFGTDSERVEWIYRAYGSVAFDAGGWGGGGVVMMINHDSKVE